LRVAIYARFSSDLQDVRSITDQVAAARDHAAKQGWQVIAEFCDAAISGASLHSRRRKNPCRLGSNLLMVYHRNIA
jgi:site-specific DNA recombinase